MLSRVVNEERAKKMKLTNTDIAKQVYKYDMIEIKNKNKLEIDNSNLSPEQTKQIILNHLSEICQKG